MFRHDAHMIIIIQVTRRKIFRFKSFSIQSLYLFKLYKRESKKGKKRRETKKQKDVYKKEK